MILVLLILLSLVLWFSMWSILEHVAYTLENNVYSAAFGWIVIYIYVKSIWPNVSFKAGVSLLNFCLDVLSIDVSGELKTPTGDFPDGTVVKNLPASVWDMGLIPGPGRSHTLWGNWVHAPKLLSLRSRACVPQLLRLHSRACKPQLLSLHATATEAHAPRAWALQQEKTPQWEACTPQWRVASAHRK